jgi:hypothetical protein
VLQIAAWIVSIKTSLRGMIGHVTHSNGGKFTKSQVHLSLRGTMQEIILFSRASQPNIVGKMVLSKYYDPCSILRPLKLRPTDFLARSIGKPLKCFSNGLRGI